MGVFDWARAAHTILDHVQTLAQTENRLPLHPYDMVHHQFDLSWLINNTDHDTSSLSIGWLSVGINASALCLFSVGFVSQWWMRTRYPRWFAKYNYILAAALDGGTQVRSTLIFLCLASHLNHAGQVMVFILSFAVQGASGKSYLFPQW